MQSDQNYQDDNSETSHDQLYFSDKKSVKPMEEGGGGRPQHRAVHVSLFGLLSFLLACLLACLLSEEEEEEEAVTGNRAED